ncbi:MAG TPA: haloacid dehalogenase type II [Thermomicrobiales bacterium]
MSDNSRPRAVLFDAYGTLFRLEAIEAICATILVGHRPSPPTSEFFRLWRTKQIEYCVHRSLMGEAHYRDFRQVTAEALDYVLAYFDFDIPEIGRQALVRAWMTPAADPEARAVLAALAPTPCAILSNGEPLMLEEAARAAGLLEHLDALLSVDSVRSYKPHPSVYALGTARYECQPSEIAFVSANSWDIAGAGAFGFRTCWINRNQLPPDRHGPPPEWTVTDLAAVPAVLGSWANPIQ